MLILPVVDNFSSDFQVGMPRKPTKGGILITNPVSQNTRPSPKSSQQIIYNFWNSS